MRTTLYEKLFIDGFHKPSYVVATVALAAMPSRAHLEAACLATLERHPRLCSLVRSRFGVPVEMVPCPPRTWIDRGGLRVIAKADVRALEEELLATPMDVSREMPCALVAIEDPPALVLKVHHAVLDATSGFTLLQDFASALAGAPLKQHRAKREGPWIDRAKAWIARVQLRPRVPAVSVVASYAPAHMLDEEPVAYVDRVLVGGHARVSRRAREMGATASELIASALLSAMHAYNTARASAPPEEVGLMFARARPRTPSSEASFRADTCLVSMPSMRLAVPHHPETLAELRRAANDTHHNDVALALLYAMRKVKGRDRVPTEQRSLQLTLSDLTAFGRLPPGLQGRLPVTDLRVLASPTSFDHAGMVVSRLGGDLRFACIAHRGALDLSALLRETLAYLGEA